MKGVTEITSMLTSTNLIDSIILSYLSIFYCSLVWFWFLVWFGLGLFVCFPYKETKYLFKLSNH